MTENASENSRFDRDAFVENIKKNLDDWNHQIDELEESLGRITAQGRQRLQADLEALRARKEAVQVQLKELELASRDAVDILKEGVQTAGEDLADSINRTRKRFAEAEGQG